MNIVWPLLIGVFGGFLHAFLTGEHSFVCPYRSHDEKTGVPQYHIGSFLDVLCGAASSWVLSTQFSQPLIAHDYALCFLGALGGSNFLEMLRRSTSGVSSAKLAKINKQIQETLAALKEDRAEFKKTREELKEARDEIVRLKAKNIMPSEYIENEDNSSAAKDEQLIEEN